MKISKGAKWLLIIVAIIVVFWWVTSNNSASAQTNPSTGSGSGAPSTAVIDGDKKLQLGSKGSEVKELQKKLNDNGSNLVVDGIFGPKTKEALEVIYGVSVTTLNELS